MEAPCGLSQLYELPAAPQTTVHGTGVDTEKNRRKAGCILLAFNSMNDHGGYLPSSVLTFPPSCHLVCAVWPCISTFPSFTMVGTLQSQRLQRNREMFKELGRFDETMTQCAEILSKALTFKAKYRNTKRHMRWGWGLLEVEYPHESLHYTKYT